MAHKRWLVFNIGCIHCDVSSGIVGTYESEEEANAIAQKLEVVLAWREGGQNSFAVFDMDAPQAEEYTEGLKA